MSKLMWIAGILLVAVGVALGLMVFVSTASVVAWGIDLHVAISMIVGGVLSLGLGSVISGLDTLGRGLADARYAAVSAAAADIPEFGRRGAEPVAQVAAAATAGAIEVSEPVKETIEALEEARQKIEQAFDAKTESSAAKDEADAELVVREEASEIEGPEPEAASQEPADEEPAETGTAAEGQLYVVEERVIRARPARILSDGTVEAETEEGWMRFENLEHLDEYLDAMAPSTP